MRMVRDRQQELVHSGYMLEALFEAGHECRVRRVRRDGAGIPVLDYVIHSAKNIAQLGFQIACCGVGKAAKMMALTGHAAAVTDFRVRPP